MKETPLAELSDRRGMRKMGVVFASHYNCYDVLIHFHTKEFPIKNACWKE